VWLVGAGEQPPHSKVQIRIVGLARQRRGEHVISVSLLMLPVERISLANRRPCTQPVQCGRLFRGQSARFVQGTDQDLRAALITRL
jgi:hypothetical protein